MRRETRLRRDETKRPGHSRPVTGVPEVPTFQPDSKPATLPPPAITGEDPSEDAVRRMVEAAYT